MKNQSYLIFELGHSQYGIPALAVQEIFFLPELLPIAEAPTSVLGIINWRGILLPVIDLYRKLGHKPSPLKLSDSVIVLRLEDRFIGVLVNQTSEVQSISSDQITSGTMFSHLYSGSAVACIAAIAKLHETAIPLLNPESLLYDSESQFASELPYCVIRDDESLYASFTADEREILSDRASNLRQALNIEENPELIPLVVAGIEGEYFGFGLEAVHEFTEIHRVSSLPCCPAHILGNMNLRGEVLTLVGIHHLINLSTVSYASLKKAIVVRLNQIVAGIAVNDIFDVVYVKPSDISTVPVAIHSAENEYLYGVAAYQNRMMSVINLPRLLASSALIVNEEV